MKILICITMLMAAAASRDLMTHRAASAQSFASALSDSAPADLADARQEVAAQRAVRFASVDVMIDTKDLPLAVYQLEFSATKEIVKIVGIEGSSHEAFREAPHYDPQAIQRERVILAAFNTAAADKLPRGKVRIATIHLQITGDVEPVYQVNASVIATVDGKPIDAAVTVQTTRAPL